MGLRGVGNLDPENLVVTGRLSSIYTPGSFVPKRRNRQVRTGGISAPSGGGGGNGECWDATLGRKCGEDVDMTWLFRILRSCDVLRGYVEVPG